MKPKRGRPPTGRVALYSHGVWVMPQTKVILQGWRDLYGVTWGSAIDDLVRYAEADNSAFRLYLTPKKRKQRKKVEAAVEPVEPLRSENP